MSVEHWVSSLDEAEADIREWAARTHRERFALVRDTMFIGMLFAAIVAPEETARVLKRFARYVTAAEREGGGG